MAKTLDDFVKEGHSAFPSHDHNYSSCGMTLRDYFAAKAMQSAYGSPREVAVESYKLADEMIAAREDSPEPDATLLNAVRAFIAASGGVSIVSDVAAKAFERMERIMERAK